MLVYERTLPVFRLSTSLDQMRLGSRNIVTYGDFSLLKYIPRANGTGRYGEASQNNRVSRQRVIVLTYPGCRFSIQHAFCKQC